MPGTPKPRVLIETDDDDKSADSADLTGGWIGDDNKSAESADLPAGLIGSDMLTNVAEIAMYLYGKADKKTKRRVYVEIAAGHWPHWKMGNNIRASKQALAEHYHKMTSGKPSR